MSDPCGWMAGILNEEGEAMERVGLVARVEEELERAISLGMVHESGILGSQQKLARSYGVSRSTVREALRRLEARGLVVQHPGRQTRVVALDEALTLENLGMVVHAEHSVGGWRLLEGYFSLKRQVTVELLADCCVHASESARQRLEDACFALWDAALWESGERCAQLEFELLKRAAYEANRPGHLLLVQSLFRAFQGIAARVLPLVDREALRQWADCAMHALGERAPEGVQHRLSPLLKACDEHILGQLKPAQEEVSEEHRARQQPLVETPPSEALAQGAVGEFHPSEPGEDCAGRTAGDGSPQPVSQSASFVHFATVEAPQSQPASAGCLEPTRVAVQASRLQPPHTVVPEDRASRAPSLPTDQDSLPREWLLPFTSSSWMKARTPSSEGWSPATHLGRTRPGHAFAPAWLTNSWWPP